MKKKYMEVLQESLVDFDKIVKHSSTVEDIINYKGKGALPTHKKANNVVSVLERMYHDEDNDVPMIQEGDETEIESGKGPSEEIDANGEEQKQKDLIDKDKGSLPNDKQEDQFKDTALDVSENAEDELFEETDEPDHEALGTGGDDKDDENKRGTKIGQDGKGLDNDSETGGSQANDLVGEGDEDKDEEDEEDEDLDSEPECKDCNEDGIEEGIEGEEGTAVDFDDDSVLDDEEDVEQNPGDVKPLKEEDESEDEDQQVPPSDEEDKDVEAPVLDVDKKTVEKENVQETEGDAKEKTIPGDDIGAGKGDSPDKTDEPETDEVEESDEDETGDVEESAEKDEEEDEEPAEEDEKADLKKTIIAREQSEETIVDRLIKEMSLTEDNSSELDDIEEDAESEE